MHINIFKNITLLLVSGLTSPSSGNTFIVAVFIQKLMYSQTINVLPDVRPEACGSLMFLKILL
jgi:hypothetical protein